MKMKNAQTLNDNRDFVRIYRRGQCQVAPLLVTYARRGPRGRRRRSEEHTSELQSQR